VKQISRFFDPTELFVDGVNVGEVILIEVGELGAKVANRGLERGEHESKGGLGALEHHVQSQ